MMDTTDREHKATLSAAPTGAWSRGGYQQGMVGTLGQSLDLASLDTLGWALRSLKYELVYNGFRGEMTLDTPVLGAAYDLEIRSFQRAKGLVVDGKAGPKTCSALLQRRLLAVASARRIRVDDLEGIVRQESGYDLAAIGYTDHDDRGLTQKHIYPDGSVILSQAIRPATALPRLADQLKRCGELWDAGAAVASWNIGEGGAEWWFEHGKPTTGSPSWWRGDQDMSERATEYVRAVRRT